MNDYSLYGGNPARIVIARASGGGNIKGVTKYIFGGCILIPPNEIIPQEEEEDYCMIDCEIVIIPKRKFCEFSGGSGYRLSQLLTSGYEDERRWKYEIINGKRVENKEKK